MKSTDEQRVIHVIIATGIASVVTQLLTIREFLAQFQGNEIVIALILFSWLVLGGIGTLLARLAAGRFLPPTGSGLGWLSLALAAVPTLQIFFIRGGRDAVFIHGASVGFYPTLAFTLATLSPYCLLVGFVLPYSLFVLRRPTPGYPGAHVYIADNIGDVAGGVLFSFVLVYLTTPLQAIALANIPLVISACRMFDPPPGRRRALTAAVAVGAVLVSGILLENRSMAPREGKLVFYKDTRYGRVEVRQDRGQHTLFGNGMPIFSSRNRILAEETVHYALAQPDHTDRILVISAQGGMLAEIGKYRPGAVDYVELNPDVSELLFRFGLASRIDGLNVIHEDGRAFLTRTKQTYDAIIVNLPEPDTFQVNRFYTDRFFALARARMSAGGILLFSMEGFDNYLAEPQRKKLSSIYNTVGGHFKHIRLIPGQRVFFVCSQRPIRVDIPRALAEKRIATTYISRYYDGNVTADRILYLDRLMDATVAPNTDGAPYLMRLMFTQWFSKFATSPLGFVSVLLILAGAYLLRMRREEFVLFSTGCLTMGSEILVIFAFQIFYGYIYTQIGLIVTVFLAGLLPGAWFGERLQKRGRPVLALTDLALVLLLAAFITGVGAAGDRLPAVFFLIYGFLVSLVCGCQFPVALHLRGGNNPAAAGAFSADLMGAALGTLLTSLVLIPYLGIIRAAVCLIGLKLISLVLIGVSHANPQPT